MDFTQDATVQVFVPSIQRLCVLVSYEELNQCVSAYKDTMPDCGIAEFNYASNETVMLGPNVDDEFAQLDNVSQRIGAKGIVQT